MGQIISALVAIVLGVGALVLYFFGSNLILDTLIPDRAEPDGRVLESREKDRERIRPWLFVGPALILLGIYLVYPAIQTFILSFRDSDGEGFVGIRNYTWALENPEFRTSIRNNILWLLIVPFLSTVFGLLVAVLADRVSWGNFAKSLIFMPMAISFVGASVIWKFVYDANLPNPGQPIPNQIGTLNAVITSLGFQPQAWITVPVWNNIFLMIILIWIQTGFAMVILSAALRGVPDETLEAARIDGANEVRIFFNIMIPQIMSTILVVLTTITITVLKVFDIVQAMTNGQWDTNVLANLMYNLMFRGGGDFGRSSAVAFVLMIAVIPILIWNIRRFQQEEAMR
ncbi:MAG: sugar ABC transporter permease [Anaerolineae bacterium]|nr:sugar ABC transporter permease [Anaerolineae bacterium]MDQ7035524.1 sugar ABC transporter permease [Anaerolineae bacterium]